jgi:hypothetical protein
MQTEFIRKGQPMTTTKPLEDLLQIVRNGGGIDMEMLGRSIADLVQIVSSAKPNSTIIFRGSSMRPTQDLVQIAQNAVGSVIFAA